MYALLLLGCTLISLLFFIRAGLESSVRDAVGAVGGDIQSVYNTAKDAYETVQTVKEGGFKALLTTSTKILLTALIALTALVTIVGALYLSSGRQYVEFTTMGGTYRVPIKQNNKDVERDLITLRSSL